MTARLTGASAAGDADLGARVEGHFEGRAYTEMWEVLAYAGQRSGPLTLDAQPLQGGVAGLVEVLGSTVEKP